MFPPEFRSIGCCKIALRYDNIDHHQLMAVLSVGHVYLFADAEMAITENIGIMFKVANWRRNVIKLSEKVVENSRETL